jgi:WD40 repeat protein
LARGRHKATLRGHTKGITALLFSPDGKTLASGSWDGTVKLWEVASANERGTLRSNPPAYTNSLAFSPDGKLLACGNADAREEVSRVILWDLPSGRPVRQLSIANCKDETYLGFVTFSPDARTLVAIEDPSTIHRWDMSRGAEAATLDWNDDGHHPLSHVGRTLLDNLLPNSKRAIEFTHCYSVCFSPNGKLIVLGDSQAWDSRKQDWRFTVNMLQPGPIANAAR